MNLFISIFLLLMTLPRPSVAGTVIKEAHAGRYACACRHSECGDLVTIRIALNRDANLLTVDGWQDVQSGIPALRVDRRTGTQIYHLASGATVSFLKNDSLRMPGGDIWTCVRE